MSKIQKLQITGVRSFNHAHGEVIEFYSPLTLIVGVNGSGKTTIIECLRYATTGELPPNSGTGGAWIRDAKLCGENEVLAQVRLAFESTSGAKMTVNRNIQLTVRKTTRSQKTLEATLVMRNAGERTVVSSRVAELDTIMPQYLGVSKAILESVIFCHQDDSLWPMSTPTVLKKKFDEIFEAMKYTKAVENIKLIRKTQVAELEKFKLIEQHAKEDKEKGQRAEQRSNELYEQINELKEQAHELKAKIQEAVEQSDIAYDHAAKFQKIVTELSGKRIEARAREESIASLKQHMKVMEDSDEALREMEDKYEERLALHQREKDVQRKRYQELVDNLDTIRSTLGSKQSEAGRYQAQKDQYERQIDSRRDLIKEIARRHDVRGFDSDITHDNVRDFMDRIGKMARDQNNAFERAHKETQDESQKTQHLLTSLNERRSALSQTKASATGVIQLNDSKISRFQNELDSIDIDEGGRAVLESAVKDLELRLSKEKKDFEAAIWDAQIQSADSNFKALEDQKGQYDSELMEASRHAKDSARLDFLRKELKDREQSLTTMTGAYEQRLTAALGPWEPSTLDHTYQGVLAEKSSDVKNAERQRDGTSRELEQIQFKVSSSTNDIKQKRKEMKSNEHAVREALGDEDPSEYLKILEEWENSVDLLKADNAMFEANNDYFKRCISYATAQKGCKLCERPFQDKGKEVPAFIKKLENKLQQDQKKTIEKDLEEAERNHSLIKAARPQYDSYARHERELPELEEQYKILEAQRDNLVAKLEQQDQVVKDCEDAKRDIEYFLKTVQNMHRYHTEIVGFETQIHELVGMQKAAGRSRGLEMIQDDQKNLAEQIRVASSHLQRLRADKERYRAQLNTLELEVRDARARLASAVHHLREKTNLQDQIEDLKSQNIQQREAMKRADHDIQALLPQIAQAQTLLDDIRHRGEERDRALQKTASKLNDSLHQLRLADQEISAYIERGGPQELVRATEEISHLQNEINRVESEQRQITVEVKKIEDILRSHSETKRAITDNLTYRENVRHLEKLRQEMNELDAHNAEADQAHYDGEGQRWQQQRMLLSAEQASIVGTLRSKDDQLKQLLEEWETDYNGAKEKYRESTIRVTVTKAAIDDLARYGGALDKAIMKYHSLKMEEINRIIDELWRSTYQGTDVDSIMIRSENETQKGNKSYNYRVVMVKQDAEMDMRGRCSAGQKVLASIIIRLALAECFGVRCGLIALDEPTTNLDKDNIRALAESLSSIIKIRKQQANFQLIVITHDEEFLRYMNCADFCDYYYRVDRADDQCSRIRSQRIQDVSTRDYAICSLANKSILGHVISLVGFVEDPVVVLVHDNNLTLDVQVQMGVYPCLHWSSPMLSLDIIETQTWCICCCSLGFQSGLHFKRKNYYNGGFRTIIYD
jgi:DNA repair protein RAD50